MFARWASVRKSRRVITQRSTSAVFGVKFGRQIEEAALTTPKLAVADAHQCVGSRRQTSLAKSLTINCRGAQQSPAAQGVVVGGFEQQSAGSRLESHILKAPC